MKEKICCNACGKPILPGQLVYPGLVVVWHKGCTEVGKHLAVMGSDDKLRWIEDDVVVDLQILEGY